MNCPGCGEDAREMRNNREMVRSMAKDYAIRIPSAEVWVCRSCDACWGYRNGELYLFGKSWKMIDAAEIPEGTMVPFNEQPL